MNASDFRRLALSFPDTREGAHMRHADFRIGGKIFATLGYPDDEHGCVMLDPGDQQLFLEEAPGVFTPASGSWGAKGATLVRLEPARKTVVESALLAAWRRKAPKAPAAKKRAASQKRTEGR